MSTSDKSVAEFKRLYEEWYKEEITMDEAREMASRVMFLYEFLAQPLPSEHNLTPPSQTDAPPSSLPDDESFPPPPGTQGLVP